MSSRKACSRSSRPCTSSYWDASLADLTGVAQWLTCGSFYSEDWDYQDFSPDKRRALLEEQVTNDVADDREPEVDALQHIHSHQLNWSGLSPEDELAEYVLRPMPIPIYFLDSKSNRLSSYLFVRESYDCTADASASSLSYEARVVLMSTPAGGIQGVPDTDTLHRFLNKAQHAMDPQALVQALFTRLQDKSCCWQSRSKVLVLIHALVESVSLAPHYLPLFKQSASLLQQLEKLRTSDHNHVARENARRALSLIQSNGANPMLIPREGATVTRASGATLASVRSKKAKPSGTTANVNRRVVKSSASSPPAPLANIKTNHQRAKANDDNRHLQTSPKIARAALASWHRRNSQGQDDMTEKNPNLLPFQSPPQMMTKSPGFGNMTSGSGAITTSAANASRYQSGQLSAFTFIQ